MNHTIEIIRKVRQHALSLIENLSDEQLNKIPAGFSNNIIWNLGHLVAAHEGICYKRNGLEAHIPEAFWLRYKPGSRPEQDADSAEIALVKGLLLSSLNQLQSNYDAGTFAVTNPWTTRYGIDINNIDEALNFIQVHEGLHLGYVMAMLKLV